MEIFITEYKEKLDIVEISPTEIENYETHILHSGKINRQVLNYIVYNTKICFAEIRKLLTFDFDNAEKNKTIIVVNGIALRR